MEYSSFFNSKNGDRKYLAEDWDRHLKDLISNGVFLRDSNNLQVTADGSGMAVMVLPGTAWMNGKHYLNDQTIVLKIDIADGVLNRVDRVVVQCSTADRTITAKIKKGTPASTAAAPSLQRDADVYELSLAAVAVNAGAITIRQADITDTRLDTSVCGAVVGLITQVGTDTLYAQIQDDLQHFRLDSEGDFSAWSTGRQSAFDSWYQSIKDVLDSNTTGHLQNEIDAHTCNTVVHITADEREKWNAKADVCMFTVSLSASGWTGSGPYTQTVSVSGLTATMHPLMDLVQSDDIDTAQSQLDAYACVSRAKTADEQLTVICYDFKPDVNITVQLEVVI